MEHAASDQCCIVLSAPVRPDAHVKRSQRLAVALCSHMPDSMALGLYALRGAPSLTPGSRHLLDLYRPFKACLSSARSKEEASIFCRSRRAQARKAQIGRKFHVSSGGLAPQKASTVYVSKQRCSGAYRYRCCILVACCGIGEGLGACGAPGPPQSGSKLACPGCS